MIIAKRPGDIFDILKAVVAHVLTNMPFCEKKAICCCLKPMQMSSTIVQVTQCQHVPSQHVQLCKTGAQCQLPRIVQLRINEQVMGWLIPPNTKLWQMLSSSSDCFLMIWIQQFCASLHRHVTLRSSMFIMTLNKSVAESGLHVSLQAAQVNQNARTKAVICFANGSTTMCPFSDRTCFARDKIDSLTSSSETNREIFFELSLN